VSGCQAPCAYNDDGECVYIEHWSVVMKSLIKPPIVVQKQNVLLLLLKHHGSMTRSQLTELSKFPRSTVYDLMIKLIHRKLVETRFEIRSHTGRPLTIYSLP